MKAKWTALLPSLLEEYAHIALKGAAPSAEETGKIQEMANACEENCQVLLDGLSSLGAAMAAAAPELATNDVVRLGYFVQYVAELAGDLASLQNAAPGYLGKASGGRHEPV